MNPATFDRLTQLRAGNDLTAARMAANAPRFEALRDRHTNGTAPRAVSAFNLFQTPPALAARMVALADVGPGHRVLEPSAGLGRILSPILAAGAADVTACDASPDCCRELFRAFPSVTLWQGDFLIRQPAASFDRIVMNPPFHIRADISHIRHALEFLAPGGVLVALCMDTKHRHEALAPLADHVEPVPAGAFRAEGTDTATLLIRIRK